MLAKGLGCALLQECRVGSNQAQGSGEQERLFRKSLKVSVWMPASAEACQKLMF